MAASASSWRVLTSFCRRCGMEHSSGRASAAIAWRVFTASSSASSWRVLARGVADTAWGVLGLSFVTAGVAWRIFVRAESASSWRILTAQAGTTAWSILGRAAVFAATGLGHCRPAVHGLRRRICCAGVQTSSAWSLFTRLARSLGWQIGIVPLGHEVIRLSCPITRSVSLKTPIARSVRPGANAYLGVDHGRNAYHRHLRLHHFLLRRR